MTESSILEVLSNVSDLLLEETEAKYPVFDTEISAWKKSAARCSTMIYHIAEPVKIRIRTVESWKNLTRHSSSTFSSSNDSHSDSPHSERRKSEGFSQTALKITSFSSPLQISGAFYQSKVSKVLKLPKVLQGDEE